MTIFFPILGFILLIILVFIVIGLTILSKVIKTILGLGQKMTGRKPSSAYTSSGRNDGRADTSYTSADNTSRDSVKKKKVFDSDEGEYVDFEEIKDK